jgi:WD40 repeat protein
MNVDLRSGLVRILRPDGETAGAGFIVTDDGLIATCAHVIETTSAGPGDSVQLICYSTEEVRQAKVEPDCWRDSTAEDVAILRLAGTLPDKVTPLPLGSSAGAIGRTFHTFGFPDATPEEGLPGKAEVIGRTTLAGYPVLLLRGTEITTGFSGAPIWDSDLQVVIGMVVSIINPGPYGRMREAAFIIPAETIWQICPVLQPRDICPYRGLEVFEAEHADYYFGRERATQELIKRLSQQNFVAIVGVSGSGKSSLVRAGLAKGLRTNPVPGLIERPRCLFIPGSFPLLNLLLALAHLPEQTPQGITRLFNLPQDTFTDIGETGHQNHQSLMGQAPRSLAKLLQDHFLGEELLLIVDQFERLYAECQDEQARRWFVETLLHVVSDEIKVLLTIRADFYGLALAHPTLSLAIKDGQMTLLPMNTRELSQAIVEPARALKRTFEPGLVEQLIADVQGRAGDLPLLEFALTELWKQDAGQGVLKTITYEGLSYATADGGQVTGVQGAVAYRAEAIWKTLEDEPERTAVRRIFLALVTPGQVDERGAQIAQDASRRAWQAELDEPARQVVEKLISARLLTTGQDPATQQPTFEVAHEALIRAWPRLQQWVKKFRPFIHWRNYDLAPLLNRWQVNDKHPDFLLPESMLGEAQSWLEKYSAELPDTSIEYVQASAKWHKRQQRQRILVAAGTLMALMVLVLIALLTWRRGETDRILARQRGMAQSASQEAMSTADDRFESALLLSLEANRLVDEYELDLPEARASLQMVLQADPHLTSIVRSPTYSVNALALSPDGRTLAYSDDHGGIQLWDVATNRPLGRPLLGHIAVVSSLAFSPDGRILASSNCREFISGTGECNGGEIRLWDVGTHEFDRRLTGHTDYIHTVAFSPDGRILASGGRDKAVILWDVDRGQRIIQLAGHTDEVYSVAFSPDGQKLASGGKDSTIRMWDLRTGQLIREPLTGHTGAVFDVAFSPDGQTLASGSQDGTIRLWDVKTGQPISQPLADHTDSVRSVVFSPDDRLLASGSADTNIILWDVETGQPVGNPLTGHADTVNHMVFSPDGQTLVSSSHDGSVVFWNIAPYYPQADQPVFSRLAKPFDSPLSDISSLAASPDGQTLALGSREGLIILWNVANGQPTDQPLTGHTGQVHSLSFSPDGQTLASSSADGTIMLWDVSTGRPLDQPLTGHAANVLSLVFSPDSTGAGGRILASADEEGTILLWDVNTGQPLGQPLVDHQRSVTSLAFSSDGGTLASGSRDDTVILWDVATRRALDTSLSNQTQGVLSIAFSPDGQTLAASGNTGAIILWDLATRSPRELVGHSNRVNSVAFSPDGRFLASTSMNKELILWDLATGQIIGAPFTYDVSIQSGIAFSPDGKLVFSGDDEGHVILWDVDPASWRDHACALVARNLTLEEWERFFPGQEYAMTCPSLPVHDTVIAETALRASQRGDAALYGQALEWAREVEDASLNNFVCSFGSYAKFKKSVPFCEEMVKLDPDNGRLRGSRGLARAILGENDADIIADFEAAVAWYRDNKLEKCVQIREYLIEQLKANLYPFDEEILQSLWDESC